MAYDALEEIDGLDLAGHKQEVAPKVPGLVLHVDGDGVAYYCSGDETVTSGEARIKAMNFINMKAAACGAESIVVHTTASGCQKGERYLIATVKPYQGQRKGDKPANHAYLQDFLQTYSGPAFRAKVWSTREADDGIAACANHAVGQASPGYIAILSDDKDLRMLPGLHVSWRYTDLGCELVRVPAGGFDVLRSDGKQYGLKWFWLQMLQGDTADHIPGLELYQAFDAKGNVVFKKMGEKTAEKMLSDCHDHKAAFDRVRELYLNAYTKYDDKGKPTNPDEFVDRFCEQAALLWMRLGNDASVIDFAKHPNGIGHLLGPNMRRAAQRLEERVKTARQEIEAFGNSPD